MACGPMAGWSVQASHTHWFVLIPVVAPASGSTPKTMPCWLEHVVPQLGRWAWRSSARSSQAVAPDGVIPTGTALLR